MTEREIFTTARGKGDSASRAAFLDEACAGNVALRLRVERLLRADAKGDVLIDEPERTFREVAATLMAGIDSSVIARPSQAGRDELELRRFLTPSDRTGSLGRLGRYDVSEVLGHGGFGIVVKALDEGLNRIVAIKVLAPQLATSDSSRQRFLREARSSAAVRHENVVQVYAVEEGPLPHLVMEFLAGETLQQRLDRVGRMNAVEVVEIGRRIANGLAAAHAIGMIHRDVKPANVFLEGVVADRVSAGHNTHSVKLLDFGLARAVDDVSMTQSGMILGTPLYMSPEQAQSQPVDHRADLFSLGCVMYAMLTGDSPFRANGTLATLKRLCEETPRPVHEVAADTPRWLSDLIAILLARNPNERIPSALSVADLLQAGEVAGLGTESQLSREVTGHNKRQETGRNWITSKRTRVACATVVVGLLLCGIVFRLKTKNFELSVEIPDSADTRLGQETGRNVNPETGNNSSANTARMSGDADPNRRAVELLREWELPPAIMISGLDWVYGDALRDLLLPSTPFPIRGLSFRNENADRFGDGLAEALDEPLRGVSVEYFLGLESRKLSTTGLAKLVRMPAFSEVSTLYLHGEQLDDGLFTEVATLSKLTNLDLLNSPRVTGKGLSALSSLPDFIILTLANCPISADALREVRSLPHLEYLNLSAVPLTDAHVAELEGTAIHELILGSTGLNDLQAERLARNESRQRLVLAGNDRITDQLLPALKPLTWLRELDFGGTSVSEAGVAELQKALPNCKVIWQPKPGP